MPSAYAWLAVAVGAALGACLRFALGVLLNPVLPNFPLGTWFANLGGAFLIGVGMEYILRHPAIPPELTAFLIPGFLGGLTTFSAFSAESLSLLLRQEYAWAGFHATAHVLGSLVMAGMGVYTIRCLQLP